MFLQNRVNNVATFKASPLAKKVILPAAFTLMSATTAATSYQDSFQKNNKEPVKIAQTIKNEEAKHTKNILLYLSFAGATLLAGALGHQRTKQEATEIQNKNEQVKGKTEIKNKH